MLNKNKKKIVIKWIIYVSLLLIAYLLQTSYSINSVFLRMKINVIPYILVAVTMYERIEPSMALWCFAGLLFDASSASVDGSMLLFYGLCGIGVSILTRLVFRRVVLSATIMGSAIILIHSLFAYIFYVAVSSDWAITDSVYMFFAKFVVSVLISPFIYFLIRKIYIMKIK